MKNVVTAIRTWSLTAAAVPVLLTCALELESLLDLRVLQLLGMGLCAQAGSNLINTYWDYMQGADTEKNNAADRGILDNILSANLVAILGYGFIVASALCAYQPIMDSGTFRNIFLLGAFLGITYTMPPLKLKYRALGDIVIYLCFGPILMQACCVVLTGATDPMLYAYSIPVGLMTEAILWAGNTRDIDGDSEAGVKTLCTILGRGTSAKLYQVIIFLCYLSVVGLVALKENYGLLLALVSLPIAMDTLSKFTMDNLAGADERTAQLHLPFGILMVVGVLLDPLLTTYLPDNVYLLSFLRYIGLLLVLVVFRGVLTGGGVANAAAQEPLLS
jgi:1,4-dihydroxy-2-naphthoate octaprenyltransferase